MRMNLYKAIGFDYGGVVFGVPGADFMQAMAEFLNVTSEELRKIFFQHHQKVNIGPSMSWIELWQYITVLLGYPEKQQGTALFIEDWEKQQVVNQDVVQLMDELRATGYKIGLLSNYASGLREKLAVQGITEYFDAIGISSEIGLMKPHPEVFHRFCALLEIQPQELVFIDDAQKSLEGADTIGYTPLLFRNSADLRQELLALGVLA